jgi:hypothetical protein
MPARAAASGASLSIWLSNSPTAARAPSPFSKLAMRPATGLSTSTVILSLSTSMITSSACTGSSWPGSTTESTTSRLPCCWESFKAQPAVSAACRLRSMGNRTVSNMATGPVPPWSSAQSREIQPWAANRPKEPP